MAENTHRVALVTGASRGIGYHAGLALAKAGHHVIAIGRTVGGLEELDDAIVAAGGTCTLVPLDLTDFDGIDRLGASIDARWGKLDVVLGNAGTLGGLSPLGHFEPKAFERTLALNLTANWRLVRSLDPLLKASSAGRVIFVSCEAARECKAFWGAYSISKAGLEALAKTYAKECENTDIRVNILHPASTRTALRAQAMPGEDPDSLPHPAEISEAIVFMASPRCTKNGECFDQVTGDWG